MVHVALRLWLLSVRVEFMSILNQVSWKFSIRVHIDSRLMFAYLVACVHIIAHAVHMTYF